MKIEFPSNAFDDAVAALCHGTASEAQCQAMNELLRTDATARDEYIIRLELHSRLASDRDLFAAAGDLSLQDPVFIGTERNVRPLNTPEGSEGRGRKKQRKIWMTALAACLALLAAGVIALRQFRPAERGITTSKAVAMLNRTADAQWNQNQGSEMPRLGAPLEPGTLVLEAGLAEIIFYSGTRLVVEGPAEIQLVSQNETFCRRGRVVAEVPEQARGFRIETPHTGVTDLGTVFGLEVTEQVTEAHVFKGTIQVRGSGEASAQTVEEGLGAVMAGGQRPRSITARPELFASLFDLQARSAAADARRHDQWRDASKRLESDPSLLVHFDFENVAPSGWQLRNLAKPLAGMSDATLVGCQWTEGRWPEKRALEFQSVSDRVRLTVPGQFQAVTLTAWVSVKGLDRKINALFMSDGFEPGTIHWVIRRDGVLGLTVIGVDPQDHQIAISTPVVSLDKFGTWLHLAVTLDANTRRITHYINGQPVGEKVLTIPPPFRIGPAELGNWNPKGFPENDPFMIRNFSGAMDDFCVFGRALTRHEIGALYYQGKPQPELEPVIQARK